MRPMLARAIWCGALCAASNACSFVSCPASEECSGSNIATAGAGLNQGTGGVAGVPTASGGSGSGRAGSGSSGSGSNASGIPPGKWVNVTGSLKGKKSGCGNLDTLFARPDADVLIAGIFRAGLWSSESGDTDWTALGTGKGSDPISNGPLSLVFDPDDPDRFWEAGIYGDTQGVYETTDGGKTFAAVGDLFHTDSVSLDFSDRQRKTLLAGGHEAAQTLWKTTDGGGTWEAVGTSLPADRWCTIALILDSKNYLVGCGQSGGLTGIFRSSDAGGHWSKVSDGGGSGRPLVASDGSIYWTTASNGQLLRSVDDGRTWVEMMPANVLSGKSPVELPDGRIAALGPQTLVVSADHGETWDYASGGLPYTDAGGLLYSSFQRAFFIWHNDCQDVVLNDAVMRFDFDYETQ